MISSGDFDFDKFLEGGYKKGVITGIYGPASTGKTTLATLCALECARNHGKVLYFDTENGFSIERAKQLAKDYDKIMDNIFIFKVKNFYHQHNKLNQILEMIKVAKLFIIDTIGFYYRNEKKEFVNKRLIEQINKLKFIAKDYNIPILVLNQVYSDLKGNIKMVGGEIVPNRCECLIELSKNGKRKAKLIKPSSKEFTFEILENGISKI